MVREVAEDMQRTNPTHEIETILNSNVNVFGDRDKLTQVLNNLISNAIKYSPRADKIIVSTNVDSSKLILSVQDFGIGITAEEQKNIFDQFYRVIGTDESIFPGMGIGLYISSEIIKRHAGKIWVESTLGKGSSFFISLPLNKKYSVQ